MALPVLAEPAYYTWVDAQGVIHNTVVPTKPGALEQSSESKRPASKSPESNTEKPDSVGSAPVKPKELEGYKTEEELQQQIKSSTDKSFYTWTDANGTLRNTPKPDVIVEFSATEIVYDAVFAPPFRLPKKITEGACCADYKNAFKQILASDSAVSQKITSESVLYQTQQGFIPAGYFVIKDIEKEIVFIKSFKLSKDASYEVVALNSSFQPLYLASELAGLYIEQTWKDFAYTKIMLELSDPEIEYLIVFANDEYIDKELGYSLSLSLGKASD
ncbi:MAG: DUF4124 domain-containing protein [Oleispira sp.]|nr:DUF4124 domain-containing protein [Oleispira sp.]MBL4882210.1 DUF4124 domain-containing protein [Oleispira sp.]